ncbi:hypothetical protein TGME49_290225 [Toxoplasma gondii ME49]|uniref:SAM domain-containing protein n=1 Tax=Toxoplasma gondii (strain ATCC 50611 / Me49) TaxID=508771 RepID=S8GHS6_TOXGM|nr:hypothetical protein TGME49_290225 [Toxoplasma gondii ME49]EPT28009.1 hypothetical protein TGME49_290225 [Toxoplasma gondii ME49]|eukprot:XP_018636428.1 hypothetical protein TGME49_290225 [Toxoplasma gondii ME49]
MGNRPVLPSPYDLDVPMGYTLLVSGDFYRGRLDRRRMPLGRGILLLREGHCHVGSFQDGLRHGPGSFVEMRKGGCVAIHSGTWSRDAANGFFRSVFLPQKLFIDSEWREGSLCWASSAQPLLPMHGPSSLLKDATLSQAGRRREEAGTRAGSRAFGVSCTDAITETFSARNVCLRGREASGEKAGKPETRAERRLRERRLRERDLLTLPANAWHLNLAASPSGRTPTLEAFVDPYSWSSEELCSRLSTFVMEGGKLPPDFIERCRKKALTGAEFMSLTHETLRRDLELSTFGQRCRVLQLVKSLKAEYTKHSRYSSAFSPSPSYSSPFPAPSLLSSLLRPPGSAFPSIPALAHPCPPSSPIASSPLVSCTRFPAAHPSSALCSQTRAPCVRGPSGRLPSEFASSRASLREASRREEAGPRVPELPLASVSSSSSGQVALERLALDQGGEALRALAARRSFSSSLSGGTTSNEEETGKETGDAAGREAGNEERGERANSRRALLGRDADSRLFLEQRRRGEGPREEEWTETESSASRISGGACDACTPREQDRLKLEVDSECHSKKDGRDAKALSSRGYDEVFLVESPHAPQPGTNNEGNTENQEVIAAAASCRRGMEAVLPPGEESETKRVRPPRPHLALCHSSSSSSRQTFERHPQADPKHLKQPPSFFTASSSPSPSPPRHSSPSPPSPSPPRHSSPSPPSPSPPRHSPSPPSPSPPRHSSPSPSPPRHSSPSPRHSSPSSPPRHLSCPSPPSSPSSLHSPPSSFSYLSSALSSSVRLRPRQVCSMCERPLHASEPGRFTSPAAPARSPPASVSALGGPSPPGEFSAFLPRDSCDGVVPRADSSSLHSLAFRGFLPFSFLIPFHQLTFIQPLHSPAPSCSSCSAFASPCRETRWRRAKWKGSWLGKTVCLQLIPVSLLPSCQEEGSPVWGSGRKSTDRRRAGNSQDPRGRVSRSHSGGETLTQQRARSRSYAASSSLPSSSSSSSRSASGPASVASSSSSPCSSSLPSFSSSSSLFQRGGLAASSESLRLRGDADKAERTTGHPAGSALATPGEAVHEKSDGEGRRRRRRGKREERPAGTSREKAAADERNAENRTEAAQATVLLDSDRHEIRERRANISPAAARPTPAERCDRQGEVQKEAQREVQGEDEEERGRGRHDASSHGVFERRDRVQVSSLPESLAAFHPTTRRPSASSLSSFSAFSSSVFPSFAGGQRLGEVPRFFSPRELAVLILYRISLLRHPHLVLLLGVSDGACTLCGRGPALWLVTEFLPKRSLSFFFDAPLSRPRHLPRLVLHATDFVVAGDGESSASLSKNGEPTDRSTATGAGTCRTQTKPEGDACRRQTLDQGDSETLQRQESEKDGREEDREREGKREGREARDRADEEARKNVEQGRERRGGKAEREEDEKRNVETERREGQWRPSCLHNDLAHANRSACDTAASSLTPARSCTDIPAVSLPLQPRETPQCSTVFPPCSPLCVLPLSLRSTSRITLSSSSSSSSSATAPPVSSELPRSSEGGKATFARLQEPQGNAAEALGGRSVESRSACALSSTTARGVCRDTEDALGAAQGEISSAFSSSRPARWLLPGRVSRRFPASPGREERRSRIARRSPNEGETTREQGRELEREGERGTTEQGRQHGREQGAMHAEDRRETTPASFPNAELRSAALPRTGLKAKSAEFERRRLEHDWRRRTATAARFRLDIHSSLRLARGIALGCAYLQRKGISYLQLRPGKVLVDESMNAQLTGLAATTVHEWCRAWLQAGAGDGVSGIFASSTVPLFCESLRFERGGATLSLPSPSSPPSPFLSARAAASPALSFVCLEETLGLSSPAVKQQTPRRQLTLFSASSGVDSAAHTTRKAEGRSTRGEEGRREEGRSSRAARRESSKSQKKRSQRARESASGRGEDSSDLWLKHANWASPEVRQNMKE